MTPIPDYAGEGKAEELARAIYYAKPRNKPYDQLGQHAQQYVKQARAVLTALRTPSEEMVEAGAIAIAAVDADGHNDAPLYEDYGPLAQADFREKAAEAFTAAISSLLTHTAKEQT